MISGRPPLPPEDPDASERPDDEVLERLAERLLEDGLGQDEDADDAPEAGGLTWIRSTLRSGGDSTDELVGSLFHGKYRILRKIGSGGFGVVYDALDERGAQNRVALKIMRPGLTQSESPLDMFRGEAVRVTRLHHPNIVDWKSFDRTPDGTYYFVMELLDGEQLSSVLEREGALDWQRATKIMLQILDGLRAAHFVGEGQSILHLDLTPKNILLLPPRPSRSETIKVIDFGIGQYLGGEELMPVSAPDGRPTAPPVPAERPGELSTITSGTRDFARRAARFPFKISQACTPEYASPEQCVHIEFADGAEREPRQLDGRADLYSFGVIAYRMLTGRLPFQPPAVRKLYLRWHQERPIDPWGEAEGRVPGGLRRFVERCLEKDPEARFKDTQEAYEELDRLLRPAVWRRLLAGAVGLVLLGVLLAQFGQSSPLRYSLTEGPGGRPIERLHAGPARLALEVYAQPLDDEEPLDPDAQWTLLGGGGETLPGWSVTPGEEPGWLRLEASAEFADTHTSHASFRALRLRADEAPELDLETRFTLVWLGRECLDYRITHDERTLSSTQAPSQAAEPSAVDPRGLELELFLPNLPRQDLDPSRLSIACAGAPLELLPKPETGDSSFLFRLTGLAPGRRLLRLELFDLAGGQASVELHLDVRPALAEFETFLLERPGDRRLPWEAGTSRAIFSDSAHVLVLESHGELQVSLVGTDCAEFTAVADGETLECSLAPLLAEAPPGSQVRLRLRLKDDVVADAQRRASHHRREVELILSVVLRQKIDLSWQARAAGELPPAYRPGKPLGLEIATPQDSDALELEVRVEGVTPSEQPLRTRPLGRGTLALDELLGEVLRGLPEGEHRLLLSAFMLDEAGMRITESPDLEAELPFVLDSRAPPECSLLEGTSVPIIASGERCPIEFRGVPDGGTAVQLDWSLIRDEREVLSGGPVDAAAVEGREQPLVWTFDPLSAHPGHSAEDGPYTLEVCATDRAGNSTRLERIPFELAQRGPEISFLTLAPFAGVPQSDWETRGPRLELVPIQVRVSDPNDIGRVLCRVTRCATRLGLNERPDWSRLTPLGDLRPDTEAGPQRWSWNFEPRAELSRAEDLYVTIEASDAHGRTSYKNSGPFRLPQLLASYRPRVGDMWLVEPRPDGPYLAGGTDAQSENDRLAALGIRGSWVGQGLSNPGQSREPWALEIPAEALAPYYLDEEQVSVGDYLEFLGDRQQGYAFAGNWRLGGVPRRERRLQLTEAFGSLDPGSPATGLHFAEAHAFATWMGKRLPTLLELEYATRAGRRYRVFSWDAGPAPEDRDDADPWRRIAGLSRGAEWTCTPEWSVEHRDRRAIPIEPAALAAPGLERLVSARAFWVRGSLGQHAHSGQDPRRDDFRSGTDRDREWSSPRVGFRCALDARAAADWRDPRARKGVERPAEDR